MKKPKHNLIRNRVGCGYRNLCSYVVSLAILSFFVVVDSQAQAPVEANAWSMSGANPQRTSWVASTSENQTDIPGDLRPEWYIPIEPYIHPKFQVIVAYDTVFVSTARGLYAFDASTGTQKWVYPTELPLGNSPALYNGVAYVGGYDKRIHAVDAFTGAKLWTFDAEAGFDTNPLIIQDMLFMGGRDGYMYALDVTDPTNPNKQRLLWKYNTNSPIHLSAAAKPDNSTIYFATRDSYGYALNAQTGAVVWKTVKLPGGGFYQWWPVYYSHPVEGDYVVFSASWDHRGYFRPGDVRALWGNTMFNREWEDLYPDRFTQSTGQLVGPITNPPVPYDWTSGTSTFDVSKPNPMGTSSTTAVTEYYEEPTTAENSSDPAGFTRINHKPWKRLYLVINPATGQEVTYDFDSDGSREYPPIATAGITHYSNRFPPIVGGDKVLYQMMDYISTTHIPQGGLVGWKINSPYFSRTPVTGATDETRVFAGGGNIIYWAQIVDRHAGAFDITDATRQNSWMYYNEDSSLQDIDTLIPGYDSAYTPTIEDDELSPCCNDKYLDAFGGLSGSYGLHGVVNPPIPYKGMIYMHKGNSLIAFRNGASNPTKLPTATVTKAQSNQQNIAKAGLQTKLEDEIRKMITAGHLKPGFASWGQAVQGQIHFLSDAFHTPYETLSTLLRVKPLIQDPALLSRLDSYIQSEWANFNPADINHIGWADGVWRDDFIKAPEALVDAPTMPKTSGRYSQYSTMWNFNPMAWYAMWLYSKEYGNASAIFTSGRNSASLINDLVRIMNPASITDAQLAEFSWVHNGYIAGLIGFSNLYDLAVSQGMAPITGNISSNLPYTIAQVKARKDALLTLRAQNFTQKTPWPKGAGNLLSWPYRSFNPSRNFIYMVPELADFLRTTTTTCADGKIVLECVRDTVDQYNRITPYWFSSRFDVSYTESAFQPLYDYNSLFQAKALILQQPFEELVKYLDVPAFARGDLFYLNNLVAALSAPGAPLVKDTTLLKDPGGRVDWSGDGLFIAFDKPGADGFYDVYTMNPDGNNETCLTCDKPQLPNRNMGNPAWHPSGEYIVFQVEKGTHPVLPDTYTKPGMGVYNDLWIMGKDGNTFWQLRDLALIPMTGTLHPHFSHDGTKLFWSERIGEDDTGAITGEWVLKLADFAIINNIPAISNIKTLQPGGTNPRFYESHGFSTDDKKLIFSGNPESAQSEAGFDIYTLDLQTNEVSNLTNTPTEWDEHAIFSPDGSKIIWSYTPSQLGIGLELWIMNPDGTNKEQVTSFGGSAGDHSWNLAGDKLVVYVLRDTGEGRIFMVELNQAFGNVITPLKGDVNNDTQVNVLDIQACVNHILGIQDLGSRADVNGDGSVNVLDVQNIVNIILGV